MFSNIYTVTIFGQSSTGDESTGRVYTAVHTKITVVVYDTFPTFTSIFFVKNIAKFVCADMTKRGG